jgi:Saxitoxin biosynthesis operon protein SxtJ
MSLLRINHHPSRRQLLLFGATWLLFFGASGASLWGKGHQAAAELLGALAVGVPVAGLAWPPALRIVYLGLSYAVYPIGFVVSHGVLAALYYLVLTPIGRVARLGGYDPLGRRFDRAAPSHWQRRTAPKPPGSYFRQS